MTTEGNNQNAMTLDEFESCLDTHGADLARWPEAVVVRARMLLSASSEAKAAFHEAKALGTLLDEAPAGDVHSALTASILEGAPGGNQSPAPGRLLGFLWPRLGWVRPTALMAASLVAGLYFGASATTTAASDTETDLFAYVFEMPDEWETGDWP